MPEADSIESRLYEHVLGSGSPQQALLNTGVLADDWTDTYLLLLHETVRLYDGQETLPREVVAAVHFASWYLNLRYDVWKGRPGRRNEQTERNLAKIRRPSEWLLLAPVLDRNKGG